MSKTARPKTSTRKQKIRTIYLSHVLDNQSEKFAKQEQISTSELFRLAVTAYINRGKAKAKPKKKAAAKLPVAVIAKTDIREFVPKFTDGNVDCKPRAK